MGIRGKLRLHYIEEGRVDNRRVLAGIGFVFVIADLLCAGTAPSRCVHHRKPGTRPGGDPDDPEIICLRTIHACFATEVHMWTAPICKKI